MRIAWLICGALAFGACDDGNGAPPVLDAARDATPLDATPLDATPLDATPLDATALDATQRDATRLDATRPDAAELDAAPADAALPDAAHPDSSLDAQPTDATPPSDAGPLDMAVADMATADMALDMGPAPENACFDAIDNDNDGRTDCADPDCRPLAACFDYPEDCDNGVDDNGDNWADCDDVLCLDVCPPAGDPPLDAAAIQARFDLVCTQCHAGAQPAARLDLTAFEETTIDVRSTQVGGFRIVSGNRQASYLWRKMAYSFRTFEGGGGEGMPPVDAESASFVDRFGDWIDAL